jgi:hypothetical protein
LNALEMQPAELIGSEPIPKRRTFKHLTAKQIALVCQLSDAGKTGCEIAAILGCDDSTVSRTLQEFGDTREIARRKLEAGAMRLVQTVVETQDAGVALKALGKLDVVREDQAGAGNTVMIAIGQPGQQLAPPVITLSPVSRNELP